MTDPIVLEGEHVRLEPLSWKHRDDIAKVALDPVLWRFTPTQIHSDKDLDEYIESALSLQSTKTAIPFATINLSTDEAIGCTRLGNIDPENRRLEIGWTWLGRAFQRKAYNTESKLLMLTHAFESMNCVRVEFRVDALNDKSLTSIARIGARKEGILRQHMVLADGRWIDWVYFSILESEWPTVRTSLEEKLRSHGRNQE